MLVLHLRVAFSWGGVIGEGGLSSFVATFKMARIVSLGEFFFYLSPKEVDRL